MADDAWNGCVWRAHEQPAQIRRVHDLSDVTWNATLITGDLAEELSRLKQQDGQDILVFGSGRLVHTLHAQGLIDEYRLMVYPVVLGSGKRLIPEGGKK